MPIRIGKIVNNVNVWQCAYGSGKVARLSSVPIRVRAYRGAAT